jgi:hypothetical protein
LVAFAGGSWRAGSGLGEGGRTLTLAVHGGWGLEAVAAGAGAVELGWVRGGQAGCVAGALGCPSCLWRPSGGGQGTFQGSSPREAYFVKVDGETTIQKDIDLGIVNIVVGFAPLRPAEFVIIKIPQTAGQTDA